MFVHDIELYIPWYEYAYEVQDHGMNMHIVNEFYITGNVFDLYGFSDTIYAELIIYTRYL